MFGIGRFTEITLRVGSPATISERGTSMEAAGSVTESTVKATISRRNVKREDQDAGGSRQLVVFDFYVKKNTIEHPNQLDEYPIEIVYDGLIYSVNMVVDWPGSHQMLTADAPEQR